MHIYQFVFMIVKILRAHKHIQHFLNNKWAVQALYMHAILNTSIFVQIAKSMYKQ